MNEQPNNNGMNERMRPFTVRATAKTVRRRNVLLKVCGIVFLIVCIVLGLLFACSAFVNKAGNFTVWIADEDKNQITLSDTPDFAVCSTMLEADRIEQMDNITKDWIYYDYENPEDLVNTNGCHNGDNYIAYTFYLKNAGSNEIDYLTQIDISAVTKEADHAVRVMVIKNGVETVYAKAQKGTTEPEPDTVPFYGDTIVLKNTTEDFAVGAVDQYTVVIWLEGNDPECIDNIKGGVVKMSMNFKVLEND